jgi:YbbR domain-containing protein
MRDWLTKDFYWKAFSLLMAIGIWLTVRRISGEPDKQSLGAPSVRNTYDLHLLAVSADNDVHNVQLSPQTVNATVIGPPEIINHLQPSQIHAVVNLTGFNSARNLLRDVEISPPPGVTVVNIDPPQVSVTLPATHE